MTLALEDMIPLVQAQLLDATAANYGNDAVTVAIRKALQEFNLHVPAHAVTTMPVVNKAMVYDLTALASGQLAIAITAVLQQDPSNQGNDIPLAFNEFLEPQTPGDTETDTHLKFILQSALTSGTLIIHFNYPHSIADLDDGDVSTLPSFYDQIIIDGSCYHACALRSVSRVEPINLNQNVQDGLLKAAAIFRATFDAGMTWAAKKTDHPTPAIAGWDDEWHGRDYQ